MTTPLIETSLVTYLLSKTAITNFVGQKINPDFEPTGLNAPFLVYEIVSSTPENSLDGYSGPTMTRFVLTAWGTTSRDARQIRNALWQVLNGYKGALGSDTAQCILAEWGADQKYIAPDNPQLRLYGAELDVRVWHVQDKPSFA